jgi:hypothetical protein
MSEHYSEQEFEELVSSALDGLPIEFQRALEQVAIVAPREGPLGRKRATTRSRLAAASARNWRLGASTRSHRTSAPDR